MAKVIVGCKLPHGIILENPLDPAHKVELNGLNKIEIIGADHATTEVDGEFWNLWETSNPDFAALKSGAIFVAKTVADAKAIAKEFKGEKTGFDKLVPDAKENGVKTEDGK